MTDSACARPATGLASGTAGLAAAALAFGGLACLAAGIRIAARRREDNAAAARLEELLRASPAGIGFIDRKLRFRQINPALARMSGRPAEDHVGRSVWDFGAPDLRGRMEPILRSVLTEGRTFIDIAIEAPSTAHGGEIRHYLASFYPLRADRSRMEGGRIEGIGAVVTDITETARAERSARESETQKSAILESALDCIVSVDEEGRIVEFNPAAERTFGHARRDVLGQPMAELIIPPEERGKHYIGMARYLATGRGTLLGQRIEVTALHADGSRFPVELAIAATDVHGRTHFTAYLRNIANRRRGEKALRDSEERFRSLVEATSAIVWTTGPDGVFVGRQPSWCAFTGQPDEAITGEAWIEAIHPDDRRETLSLWRRAISRREVYVTEHRVRRHDGEYRYMLVRAVPVLETDGRVREWVGVHTDITERRRAEVELAAAKEAAEEANRAKSRFLANMSHELRTPLSAVIGYAEMLEEEVADLGQESILTDLRKITGNARHLLSLINDVLDISKIEAGRMEVHAESFDVAAVIDGVAATAQPLVAKKRNRLTVDVPPHLGHMHSDVVKIRQCLFNLLSNASKFTEGGRIVLSAERAAEAGREWLVFRVRDTGIGMSDEQIAKLFRRFAQADSSTTRRFGGTGLGLAITKAFCTMLGGTVAVESAPGAGSTFTMRLPADLAATPGAISGAGTGEPAVAPGNLVLVIDDDAPSRELLARFLTREGFAVRTAGSGRAGLDLARELRPRAILLDVMMPRMDGWSVLSAMKADPALADIPVIMVTFVPDRTFGHALGAADYVTKPVDWGRLKSVLDRYRCANPPCPVLIVDDDADIRALLREALERDRWSVVEAGNGRVALERMKDIQPAAILLDLTMPVMDGFAFVHAMRRRPEWRDIPVVVVTARDITAAERARLDGRVHKIIHKDEEAPEALIQEVRRVVTALNPVEDYPVEDSDG